MSEVFFLHRSHPHPITQIPRRGRVGPETCEICTSKAACQWWALFCGFWWCLCFLQVRAAPPPPKQLAQGQVQKREEVEITLVWLHILQIDVAMLGCTEWIWSGTFWNLLKIEMHKLTSTWVIPDLLHSLFLTRPK